MIMLQVDSCFWSLGALLVTRVAFQCDARSGLLQDISWRLTPESPGISGGGQHLVELLRCVATFGDLTSAGKCKKLLVFRPIPGVVDIP
jgi:hypothetical protein